MCEKYPIYVLDEHDNLISFIYIDENRGLTIKSIDKKEMQAVSSTIQYNAIHYYEKAGTIFYVSKTNIEYNDSAIAASFVPAKMRITPIVLGTLLLGPMGMAIGAALGYESAHFSNAAINKPSLSVTSETTRIDDRSVILNYFSEMHQQYEDIELPHDIYNFLQTHLAEKKYDIVLAREKQTYARVETIPAHPQLESSGKSVKATTSLDELLNSINYK